MTSTGNSLVAVTLAILSVAVLTACGNERKSVAATESPSRPLYPLGTESIVLRMGCFWGAEKRMAALPGIVDVASGDARGNYEDPSYRKLPRSGARTGVRFPG